MVPSWVASKVGLARGPARTKLPLPKCPCSHRPLAQLAPMPVGLVRSPMGEMPPKLPEGCWVIRTFFDFWLVTQEEALPGILRMLLQINYYY